MGFHFFNPVAVMPLLEIIPGEHTDDAALATAFATGRALGKTTIRVKDTASFVVNRLLARFMGEFSRIVDEGTSVAAADRAVAGMAPMPPFVLLGLVGPAIALHNSETLHRAFGDRFHVSPSLRRLVEAGKRGYYRMEGGRPVPDPEVLAMAEHPEHPVELTVDQARERILGVLADEVGRMLAEGVVAAPMDIDLAMITGAGFQFWNGGLCPLLDREGRPGGCSVADSSRPGWRASPPETGGCRAAAHGEPSRFRGAVPPDISHVIYDGAVTVTTSDTYLTRIGTLIRDARRHQGLTQSELADLLGTSQSAVARIEQGKQNLSLEMLARVGEKLDSEFVSLGHSGPQHLRIVGGHKLSGSIPVKTSKNAAVALLCASLLNKGRTTLRSLARIEEVNRIIEVLTSIGVRVRWLPDSNDLEIVPPARLDLASIDVEAARRTRTVIMFFGPLLHELPSFQLPYAGGCDLGTRTIEPHLSALKAFGLDVAATHGFYEAPWAAPASRSGPSCSPSAATR